MVKLNPFRSGFDHRSMDIDFNFNGFITWISTQEYYYDYDFEAVC